MRRRSLAERAARRLLASLPLRVWETLAGTRWLGLCYHIVSDERVPHVWPLFSYKSLQQFTRDMEYVAARYGTDEWLDIRMSLSRDMPGKKRGMFTSFDDGLVECYTKVRPILNSCGARGVFFVITDCLDNRSMMYRHKLALCIDRVHALDTEARSAILTALNDEFGVTVESESAFARYAFHIRADRISLVDELCDLVGVDVGAVLSDRKPYLSRQQVRKLSEEGHVIGAHSLNHVEFKRLEPDEIERQIVESCRVVADLTGRTSVPFAAPFTIRGVDRDLLCSISRAHTEVGLICGTGGVEREPPGIINRVNVDLPPTTDQSGTNLPLLLRTAYANNSLRPMGRALRAFSPLRTDA